MGIDPADYRGREQAFVKHTVLQHYVRELALKVGQYAPGTTLNYVDGFSGPYDHGVALGDERPTSPFVALSTLRDVREQLRARQTPFVARGMFVEAKKESHERLVTLCGRWKDVETLAVHGEFEDNVALARTFATTGPRPFAFVFIDPTGWTGFGMKQIAPLIRVRPCEVLVNFMLKDIMRFIDDERAEIRAGFEDLFGQSAQTYRIHWRGLSGQDREEAIVHAYCQQLGAVGGFAHCASTIVINPLVDRTHYHLVFATRSLKGLIVFRETERLATKLQIATRAEAKQSKRVSSTGQLELLGPVDTETSYFESLRVRFHQRSRERVLNKVGLGQVSYDDVVATALSVPLCCEQDLKTWITEWQSSGRVRVHGLAAKERVPKVGRGHTLSQR